MINGIVAVDKFSNGIGFKNALPWKLPSDLRYFKEMTSNDVVVMGYNTMLSLKKPLIDRKNIVLFDKSRGYDKHYKDLGFIFKPIDDLSFLDNYDKDKHVWVIGGSNVYNLLDSYIEKWYITLVNGNEYQFDSFFHFDCNNPPYGFIIDVINTHIVRTVYEQPSDELPRYNRIVYTRVINK